MGLFDRLKENAMKTVAQNTKRAADAAESKGYSNQAKLNELRQASEQAKYEAEMLQMEREAEERDRR